MLSSNGGAVSAGQLASSAMAAASSGKGVLASLGLVDEQQVLAELAKEHGLEVANLSRGAPNRDAVALLDERDARRLRAVPIEKQKGGPVLVAVTHPDAGVEAELTRLVGSRIRLLLATPAEIDWAIDTSYRAVSGLEREIAAFAASHPDDELERPPTRMQSEAVVQDTPVVAVVNMIITEAVRRRASDVHMEPTSENLRVRFRVDGALREALVVPSNMISSLVSRLKIMAGMDIVERRRPQDGQICMEVDGHPLDIRVATVGVIWGEKVVLRLLDKSREVLELRGLGMARDTYQTFRSILRSPYGMVLSAGPTGSGKTTTLYAALNAITRPEINIVTIEDPVEYTLPAINQISVDESIGVDFAGALRAVMRQDPDAILVGEIRDVETAQVAIQAAMTGHFVMSTIHATDAARALLRLLDMSIEPFLVASSVIAVVGQRLVRRICSSCRVPYERTKKEIDFYEKSGGRPKTTFWAGRGCNFCSGTGYQGRTGVFEVLTVTDEMRDLLVSGDANLSSVHSLAASKGMRALRSEGLRLAETDVTTIAEIIRSTYVL
ncbi:MAG: GspE/PulE family protein [Candidatus Nanopelagicales bacterium]|nr:GspE/PulE family protein [Candidatus Nanopelagicales bacterium]